MLRATHTFVGRTREIEELRACVLDAIEGQGSLCLITGEPGIGKSRLLEEAARIAADSDVQVLWGRCWEVGGAPAFWPWIQILRAIFERSAIAESVDASVSQRLWELIPELGDTPTGTPPVPDLEPEQARFRLMDTVTRALRSAATASPLLVLIEDLHAADPSTLLLLSFVARQLRDARIVVVGTMREAEAQRSEAHELFERLLNEAQRIGLTRLERAQVETYLAQILDRAPDAQFVDAVFATTEGNPLFVGELARFLVRSGNRTAAEGFGLPSGIRGAIRARLALLSPATRAVLQCAAAIGRECRRTTLIAIATDAPGIDSAIDESAAAEVMLEAAPGVLRFSHVLLQQVIYADMEAATLHELHARIARQLEAEQGSASERAHHWLAAGDEMIGRAAQAALDAAHEAESRHALSETVHWYGRAWEAQARARSSSTERCEILLALGHAQIVANENAAGRKSCQEAAAIARQQGDADLLARAALAYGAVSTLSQVHQPLVLMLQEALTALPAADSPIRARVMARLAAAMQPAEDLQPPIRLAREAIAMARRVAEPRTLLSTIAAACSAMMDVGDPVECYALHQEHVALARQLGDLAEEFRGNLRVVFAAYEVGEHATARAAILACEAVGAQLAQPHYLWRAEALMAMRDTADGNFADADAHMERARELGLRAGDPNAARTYANLRLTSVRLQGRVEELTAAVDALGRSVPREPLVVAMTETYLGAQLAWGRDRVGALGRVRDFTPFMKFMTTDATLFEPFAELAALTGNDAVMKTLYDASLPRAQRWSTGGVFGFTWDQPVTRGLGRIAGAQGRFELARTHYDDALTRLRRQGLRALLVWTLCDAIELAQERGDLEAARAFKHEAESVAAAIGIRLPVSDLAALPPRAVTAAPVAAVPDVTFFEMQREGDYWSVRCEGRVFRVKDGKGIAMLARLVERPGHEFHVLDVVGADGAIDRGDSGELLDPQARSQYRARVSALRETIEEAESRSDLGRAERARQELDQLTEELARAVGLGGKSRRAGAAAERARVNVQRRLRDAVSKLGEHDPELGRHLEWAVKTGTYCSYRARA